MLAACTQPSVRTNTFEYTAIDVTRTNQGGEAGLIIAPDGKAALIDTGVPTMGAAVIVPYLASRGISRLESVWISHEDVDHVGGLAEILDRIEVGTIYVPPIPWALFSQNKRNVCQPLWNAMLAKAASKGVPVVVVSTPATPGNPTATLGDLDFYVMQAHEQSLRIEWPEKGKSMMFLADMPEPQINNLIASGWTLTSNVLKTPHHGVGDTNFKDHIASFPTDAYMVTGTEKNIVESAATNGPEMAAIKATGKPHFYSGIHGSVSFVIEAGGQMNISTAFTPYYYNLGNGRQLYGIYGAAYNPSWAQ
jgi:competence protein ComEC